MQISAQVRYLDYTARSLNAKRQRRGTDEPLLIPVVGERTDEEQRKRDARQAAFVNAVVEDDDGVEYSRTLSSGATASARTLATNEDAATLPLLVTVAPWGAQASSGGPAAGRKPKETVKTAVHFRNDALFDLLDQVVAKA